MPPRTRRAVAKKQNQYRISDDDEETRLATPPSKRRVGGVLASLSRNVPATKNQKGDLVIADEKSEAKKIESVMKTPPPPRSVTVGKNQQCSPLTQPRIPKSQKNTKKVDKASDDSDSMFSVETSSPVPTRRLPTTKRRVIDDDESSDDDTVEIDEEVNKTEDEDDQSATLGDSEEEEDESEDDVECDVESAEDSQDDYDEEEEDDEDEEETEDDAYEPEDDEYVPDDEEENVSDEDLDDFVEEEKEVVKPRTRTLEKKETQAKVNAQPCSEESTSTASVHLDEGNADDQSTGTVFETESIHSVKNLESDDITESEETPCKQDASIDSPELEAVIVDDDDDLDDDEDVLIATIVDDDDDDDDDQKTTLTGTEKNFEAEDAELVDDGPCLFESDENEHAAVEAVDDDVEANDKQKTISSTSYDVVQENGKLSNIPNSVVASGESGSTKQAVTPQTKKNKPRTAISRGEGAVKRGKWKLGSKIGVGSFGHVHVGMNIKTGKLMAVKQFELEKAEMADIRREVELMRSLSHVNIVRYLGAQMDKSHLYIFQEWVPGGSVATLLSKFGPFSLPVIQSYLSQTLDGLAYLHENDIMHRDIKGSNILVNDEGVVKLADFGASKKLSNLKSNLMMSLTVRGTPYFMAPEVFEEKYSAKADVWGIGCVAYQMITGTPPWKDKGFSNPISLFNYIKKHTGAPPVDDEHVERLCNEEKHFYARLCDLMDICFHKDPAARPDVHNLLEHNFFTEMHPDDESIYSRGLFSPVNKMRTSIESMLSQEGDSQIKSPSPMRIPAPTSEARSRSKSVIQWRTTFASPPRTKNGAKKKSPSPLKSSPYHSPLPDTSNWPDWARAEIEKRDLFNQSAGKLGNVAGDDANLSAMMGSLALSEDSEMHSANPNRRDSRTRISTVGTTADESRLAGLNFLEDSNVTYEI